MKKTILLLAVFVIGFSSSAQYNFSLFSDINSGANSSFPNSAVLFKGKMYYIADDGSKGSELWVTDGTTTGTQMVKDIYVGSTTSNPNGNGAIGPMVIFNNELYFTAETESQGLEIWKSDGTESGTIILKDLNPGPSGSGARGMVVFNDSLYFIASNGVNGNEIWRTDGTTAGTQMALGDFFTKGDGVHNNFLSKYRDKLYFGARDGSGIGVELWSTDGSASGTGFVKDINPSGDSDPFYFTELDGKLYFSAKHVSYGRELWVTDGTASGTKLVKDIKVGIGSSEASYLISFKGDIYFAAEANLSDRELWKSDGTNSGTQLLKNINSGSLGSNPNNFKIISGRLFFAANSPVGKELWVTDGTDVGTLLADDIFPGVGTSWPIPLLELNGNIYIGGDDGTNGHELLVHSLSPCTTKLMTYFRPSVFGKYNVFPRGGSNGSIQTHILGGEAPYTYSWRGPSNATGSNPKGLKAGSYFLIVTDRNGCKSSADLWFLREP